MSGSERGAADILDRIVARRRERLAGSGPGDGPRQGLSIPAVAGALSPPRPFPAPLICEIKRRSPSRGTIAGDLDPVAQARRYREAGARALSILTEQDHFGGSLADLLAVRRALPDLAILRKDFLLTPEDVEISREAGADAVLLIAAILDGESLRDMLLRARELGLAALVEIHNREELAMIRPLKPQLIGINARDLRTFRVDLLEPLALAAEIDWGAELVFESGLFNAEDALLARDGGFTSLLVGEAVVREPERIRDLAAVMGAWGTGAAAATAGASVSATTAPGQRDPFWTWCARRRTAAGAPFPGLPLVKICGITNREDALLAQELGADMLGLVYARSPRAAPPGLAAELAEVLDIPLVGVVVEETPEGGALKENLAGLARAQEDLASRFLAALQLHGAAPMDRIREFGWPAYKAIRPATPEEARALVSSFHGPRVLIDAYHRELAGGTGLPVNEAVLDAAIKALRRRPQGELWLAGGLGPDTILPVLRRWRPELVDASSALEAAPGRKDRQLMKRFFSALKEYGDTEMEKRP